LFPHEVRGVDDLNKMAEIVFDDSLMNLHPS